MSKIFAKWVILSLYIVWLKPAYCSDEVIFDRHADSYFDSYVIRAERANTEIECGSYCMTESSCVSTNFKVKGENKGLCELNSKVVEDVPGNRIQNTDFVYQGIIQRNCPKTGQVFSTRTKKCMSFKSCKEILEDNENAESGIYTLFGLSLQYNVYCHMTGIAGCGNETESGWTLVMKVNGNENNFGHNSPYWTNKKSYAVEDGLEGVTEKESKLASYWNTPFKKICLGMTVNGEKKWMMLDYEASSLYSVIVDGHYRKTTAGLPQWFSLMKSGAYWYTYCVIEGFNINKGSFSARIGFASNDPDLCINGVGTAIGFGIQFDNDEVAQNSKMSAGRAFISEEEYSETRAFGYILVT